MGDMIRQYVYTALIVIFSVPMYLSVLIQVIYIGVLKIICYPLKGIFKDIDPYPIYDKMDKFEKYFKRFEHLLW